VRLSFKAALGALQLARLNHRRTIKNIVRSPAATAVNYFSLLFITNIWVRYISTAVVSVATRRVLFVDLGQQFFVPFMLSFSPTVFHKHFADAAQWAPVIGLTFSISLRLASRVSPNFTFSLDELTRVHLSRWILVSWPSNCREAWLFIMRLSEHPQLLQRVDLLPLTENLLSFLSSLQRRFVLYSDKRTHHLWSHGLSFGSVDLNHL